MPTPAADSLDLVFRALADRTRLRILNLLTQRPEICVCDLMAVLDLPQAKVSRHLAYLRRAGLVAGRRDQQWMHYRLLPPQSKLHAALLDCLTCCNDEAHDLQCDCRRLRGRRVAAGCRPTVNCCGPRQKCR
jgi:ArsR family transcriptional regulator